MMFHFSKKPRGVAEETQRRGELVLRTLPILLIPILSAAVAFVLVRLNTRLPLEPAARAGGEQVSTIIIMAVFFTALIMLVRVGRPTVSALLLIGVWTLITTLLTLRGGIGGIGPAFLIIPICAAGLLIDGLASMSLAGLATVLVVSMAWLELNGVLVAPGLRLAQPDTPFPSVALPIFLAAVWTGIYWTVALLTSLLAGDLQRALERSHEQAQALSALSNQLEARVAAQTAELERRASRAEALYEVSQALTGTPRLDHILSLITEQGAHLLGFDSAYVLQQQAGGSFKLLGIYPRPADGDAVSLQSDAGGPVAWQIAALEPLLNAVIRERTARVTSLPPVESPADGQPAPGMAVILPMHYSDRVAGVLMLTSADNGARCDSDDLVLGQGLADQAAVAIANAQLFHEAREAAILEERTRLARDIHDTLAQGLTGVVVQLGATQRALTLAPDEAREHLAVALRMARESLAEARRSVWNLRAPALERGDLGDVLRTLTVRPLGANVEVSFEQRGQPWALTSAAESTLLRVAQEALTNVAKHAQATEAHILLEYRPEDVYLRIQDNGIGLDRQVLDNVIVAPGPWGGFGLVGMRERINALGGTLDINGDGGVEIQAMIPRPAGDIDLAGKPSDGRDNHEVTT